MKRIDIHSRSQPTRVEFDAMLPSRFHAIDQHCHLATEQIIHAQSHPFSPSPLRQVSCNRKGYGCAGIERIGEILTQAKCARNPYWFRDIRNYSWTLDPDCRISEEGQSPHHAFRVFIPREFECHPGGLIRIRNQMSKNRCSCSFNELLLVWPRRCHACDRPTTRLLEKVDWYGCRGAGVESQIAAFEEADRKSIAIRKRTNC